MRYFSVQWLEKITPSKSTQKITITFPVKFSSACYAITLHQINPNSNLNWHPDHNKAFIFDILNTTNARFDWISDSYITNSLSISIGK